VREDGVLVELSQCVFGYGKRPVVRVDGLGLEAGRCLGIFGANGSGKTTVARGMSGLLPPMGGQQQRILLAGAVAARPDVLLLDEPTDGLDVHSRKALLDLLREFGADGLTTVFISHEVEDLLYLCDSVVRVHPADDREHPARVEVISPAELARQIAAAPHPTQAAP
jgi:ABC-type Mn2+/Zn2+ transport system ATPase subunit